ncbi:MAG: protein kinase domain-containing protein [Myxococcota bacterium]
MKFCPTCKSKFPTDINYCPNDATKLINDPESGPSHSLIGMILDNRYQIISKLGEGGMGSVYSAEHILLKKNVAIKVLRYDLARKEDVVRRFQNEAIAASKIGHENIIEVTDFGKTPDGSVYFVMEHLNGMPLSELIQKSGSIPLKRAVPILLQITKALSAAHAQGIIHRDLKPENIVLIDRPDRKDFVKILDFGISKMLDTSDRAEKLTAMGMIVGTPEYMSPEQASGMSVDNRTDIYSLGVIMYEMMTGRLPFLADNAIRILMMHQTEKPQSPREINPDIHIQMEQIILKCLNKRPEDRFQDMTEITQALIQLLSSSTKVVEPKKTIAFNPQQVMTSPEEAAIPSVEVSAPPQASRFTAQYNSQEMGSVTANQSSPLQSAISVNKTGINDLSPQPGRTISGQMQITDQSQSSDGAVIISTTIENKQAISRASSDVVIEQQKTSDAVIPVDESAISEEIKAVSGGNRKWVAIVIVILILIFAASILFFFTNGGGKKEEKTVEVAAVHQPAPVVTEKKVEQNMVEPESEKGEDEKANENKVEGMEVKTEKKEGTRPIRTARVGDGIVITVRSMPENVEIYSGGLLLGVTPYQLKGKKNSSQEFIFKKVGYEPIRRRLVFDSSKDLKIELKKIEEKKGPPQKEKDPFEKIDDLKDLKF